MHLMIILMMLKEQQSSILVLLCKIILLNYLKYWTYYWIHITLMSGMELS